MRFSDIKGLTPSQALRFEEARDLISKWLGGYHSVVDYLDYLEEEAISPSSVLIREIAALSDEINSMEREIDDLESALDSAEYEISRLEDDIIDLEGTISGMESEL